jgi:hypothetical protein
MEAEVLRAQVEPNVGGGLVKLGFKDRKTRGSLFLYRRKTSISLPPL